jgi:hypothetical protein
MQTNKYLDELRENDSPSARIGSTHIQSVPVKESHGGKTVWEGIVEVFELHGRPKATHAYAWAHDANGGKRHVAVFKIPPVVSPETAVRAEIVQEFRLAEES